MTDRFYDEDVTNNDSPQSPNLYDPNKSNWKLYWGGDWAGIQAKILHLDYPLTA